MVLVSRQAVRVGLGSADNVAGLGRADRLVCRDRHCRGTFNAGSPCCISRLQSADDRALIADLLRDGRAARLALGRAVKGQGASGRLHRPAGKCGVE